eukprot:ANDGO_08069.mRNA.1 SKP1-like protein 11
MSLFSLVCGSQSEGVNCDGELLSQFSSVVADAFLSGKKSLSVAFSAECAGNIAQYCENQFSAAPSPFMVGSSARDWLLLLKAAQSLKMKTLSEVCCVRIADMIRGKTTSEMQSALGIVDDFSDEQKEFARERFEWVFSN